MEKIEFYDYNRSPFEEEPINIQDYVAAVIRHMQARDPQFNAATFRSLIARIDEDELHERIRNLDGDSLRYNNKAWLEQTIESNVHDLMKQAGGMR